MFSIYDSVRAALRPSPRLAVDEWLREHVRLERGHIVGPLEVRNSPWILEPLSKLRDHTVRTLICACSVQSAKTLFAEAVMLYLIAEQGGDMGLYLQTDELADEFLDTRFKQRLLACPPVRNLLSSGMRSIQKRTVSFVHMTQFVLGSANIHNVQSKALRYVIGDEAAYWINGRMDEVEKRTTSFDGRNSKRIFISTPLNNSGEFYRKFCEGTMAEWMIRCPECQHPHKMVFNNLKWDGPGARLEDGKYNLNVIDKSLRYVCPACQAEFKDEPLIRHKMSNSGFYQIQNPNADPSVVSYHWNALTVPWVRWLTVVSEFLKAEHARRLGDYTPISEWVRKRLGEFWDLRQFEVEDVNLTGGFQMLEPWDREFRRYMTVDVQKDYYRVVIRLWAEDGSSRLYYAGEVGTWGQVLDLQVQHNVQPRRTFIDCGFERYTMEVYRQCAANGWIAVKGDRAKFFTFRVIDRKTGRGTSVRRPYSPIEKVDSGVGLRRDPRLGKQADLADRILWASDYIKLILVRMRGGKGASWEIASDAPSWYHKEIANEIWVKEEDKRTKKEKWYFQQLGPNHSFDCEAMQIVGACIDKIISQGEVVGGEGQIADPNQAPES